MTTVRGLALAKACMTAVEADLLFCPRLPGPMKASCTLTRGSSLVIYNTFRSVCRSRGCRPMPSKKQAVCFTCSHPSALHMCSQHAEARSAVSDFWQRSSARLVAVWSARRSLQHVRRRCVSRKAAELDSCIRMRTRLHAQMRMNCNVLKCICLSYLLSSVIPPKTPFIKNCCEVRRQPFKFLYYAGLDG